MLNHHHLYHFWSVVREGGVTRASEKLHVSQPTISGQLRELEEALGEKLLVRSGRTVVLTDIGRTVYRYADEILGLDRELLEAVKGRPTRPGRLAVGVTMVVPKLVAYQMLEPALRLLEPIRMDCVADRLERLLAELAIYALDLVLADAPAPPAVKVRAYSHLLGECGVSVLGAGTRSGSSSQTVPALVGRRTLPPAERGLGAALVPRGVVPEARDPAPRGGDVRGQRSARRVRTGGNRTVRDALGHRGQGEAAVQGPVGGTTGLGAAAVLRDHRREETPQSRFARDLRASPGTLQLRAHLCAHRPAPMGVRP